MSATYTHMTSTTTRQPMLAIAKEPVTGTSLLEAAYGGKIQFAKVRGTGTLRHWPVLAKGSAQRKDAESIEAQVAKSGVAATAKERNVSVATLRRTLTALAFTKELEAMSAKDRAALAKAANANRTVAAEAKPAPKEETKPETKAAPKEQKAAPAKATAKATGTKSRKETPGQRVQRMQREGKAPVKSPSEE